MSAALHNRLRRVETGLAAWEAATEGQFQQVSRAALATLSDQDLGLAAKQSSPWRRAIPD